MKSKMNCGRTRGLFIGLAATLVFIFAAGCTSPEAPSDKEAVQLVRDHYLFYERGESVQAEVLKRGELLEACNCYPITFRIISSGGRASDKRFYFYKNEAGIFEVSEFMPYDRSSAD